MNQKVRNVLFVCSGNSGRSVMAESILGRLGQGQFHAFSAGSHPTGRVNPLAIEQLARRAYPTRDLASKSTMLFLGPGAPKMDFVITVCALAAREIQPCWPGNPETLFWRFEAPGAVQGSDVVVRQAFSDVCDVIEESVKLFVWQNSVQHHLAETAEPKAAA